MTAPPRPDRTLISVLAIIAGLVAVALAVVFFRGGPQPLAESTPAGVVQRYAAAVLNNDGAAAARYNWLVATAPWQLTICPVPTAKP